MHLPVNVKEIQAGYLNIPYFMDLYLYLAQNKLLSTKTAIQKVEILAERYILLDSALLKNSQHTRRRDSIISHIRSMCR